MRKALGRKDRSCFELHRKLNGSYFAHLRIFVRIKGRIETFQKIVRSVLASRDATFEYKLLVMSTPLTVLTSTATSLLLQTLSCTVRYSRCYRRKATAAGTSSPPLSYLVRSCTALAICSSVRLRTSVPLSIRKNVIPRSHHYVA